MEPALPWRASSQNAKPSIIDVQDLTDDESCIAGAEEHERAVQIIGLFGARYESMSTPGWRLSRAMLATTCRIPTRGRGCAGAGGKPVAMPGLYTPLSSRRATGLRSTLCDIVVGATSIRLTLTGASEAEAALRSGFADTACLGRICRRMPNAGCFHEGGWGQRKPGCASTPVKVSGGGGADRLGMAIETCVS